MAVAIKENYLKFMTKATIQFFDGIAGEYWKRTQNLDLSEHYKTFLSALPIQERAIILDFGCGAGRDMLYFKNQGHDVFGIEGSPRLANIARESTVRPVRSEDFLDVQLDQNFFDGIFAYASLFHIPKQALTNVLGKLADSLVPGGVLFTANPIGNHEDWNGESYGNYMELDSFKVYLEEADLQILHYYDYEVGDLWRSQQYLAILCRRS